MIPPVGLSRNSFFTRKLSLLYNGTKSSLIKIPILFISFYKEAFQRTSVKMTSCVTYELFIHSAK